MFLKNHIDLMESSYWRVGFNFSGDGPVSDEIRGSAGTVSRRRKLTAGDAHDQIFCGDKTDEIVNFMRGTLIKFTNNKKGGNWFSNVSS